MILPLALIFTCFRLSSSLECGSPGESFHHETDCRSYYVCDNMKRPQLFTCQDGQHYGKIQRICIVGDDEECALNKDESASEFHEEKTTMRVHDGQETPYKFTLDLKKVLEKLSKHQNNQEEESKEGQMGDKNEEHIEKRQIKEDERKNDDDEIHESPNKKQKTENPEDNSQKELEDTVSVSGVVRSTDQKELFHELPLYPGLVPLNVQTKSSQTIMSYGYPETVEQYKDIETVEEVKEEEERHDLIGKGNTTGEKHQGNDGLGNSGERTDNVEEENEKGEKEHTKVDKEDKLESNDDENPVNGDEKVHKEDLQNGENVDGSIGQKVTDVHKSAEDDQWESVESASVCSTGEKTAHPNDCRAYYVCNLWGRLQQNFCSAGQHFNPEWSVCDNSEQKQCGPGVKEPSVEQKPDDVDVILPRPPDKHDVGGIEEKNWIDFEDEEVGQDPIDSEQDNYNDNLVDTQIVQNVDDEFSSPTNIVVPKSNKNYTHSENSDL